MPSAAHPWKKGYRILAPTGRLGMFGISAAASGKERNILGMVSMLAGTPWLQFNPLALMNANKGVFGVNLGHMWGEVERLRGWAAELLDLWRQGVIKPKIAQGFRFDEARACASLYSRPQEYRQSAAGAVARL